MYDNKIKEYTLEKTERKIMNEEARNTCNIGNTTLREDIQNKNKAQKTRRLTPTTTKTGNKTKAKKKPPIKKIHTVNLTKHPDIESSCSSSCF
jgi:hypothetical protein